MSSCLVGDTVPAFLYSIFPVSLHPTYLLSFSVARCVKVCLRGLKIIHPGSPVISNWPPLCASPLYLPLFSEACPAQAFCGLLFPSLYWPLRSGSPLGWQSMATNLTLRFLTAMAALCETIYFTFPHAFMVAPYVLFDGVIQGSHGCFV